MRSKRKIIELFALVIVLVFGIFWTVHQGSEKKQNEPSATAPTPTATEIVEQ